MKAGEQETKFTDTSNFSRQGLAQRKYLQCIICLCILINVRLHLSRGERQAHMTWNPIGSKRTLTPIPLTQNPPPRSTGFGPGPRAPASQGSSAPKHPNALLRPPRPPPLYPLSLPSPGALKPTRAKKEVSSPKAAETRCGRALDTCEARHLRANRGPPGLPRAHPLGSEHFAEAGSSVPAKPASYRRGRRLLISMASAPSASRCRCRCHRRRRRWRPGDDELRTPPPCPPRRAAPRTALWGGKGGKEKGSGRGGGGGTGRERGGPAEGRGSKELGVGERGRGEG